MLEYKRIMFKVSGESLMGEKEFGHDANAIKKTCNEIADIYKKGVEICLVVGGGNICRGATVATEIMERPNADYMGMLATVMNGMALQAGFKKLGIESEMFSALSIERVVKEYNRKDALEALEKKKIVIFVGGTGNPYFSTDSGSVLRAGEMNCDIVLKGTQVDGVYDSDPKKNPNAKRYDAISYDDVISKNLKVMDGTAFTMARDINIPIIVFKISEKNAILDIVQKKGKYTIVNKDGKKN